MKTSQFHSNISNISEIKSLNYTVHCILSIVSTVCTKLIDLKEEEYQQYHNYHYSGGYTHSQQETSISGTRRHRPIGNVTHFRKNLLIGLYASVERRRQRIVIWRAEEDRYWSISITNVLGILRDDYPGRFWHELGRCRWDEVIVKATVEGAIRL